MFVFVLNIISKSNLKQIIIHLCVSEIGGWPTTPLNNTNTKNIRPKNRLKGFFLKEPLNLYKAFA